MTYFLDTNICIHFLKGDYPGILENFNKHKASSIVIPSIVVAELRFGAEKSEKKSENYKAISGFLEPFAIAPFDDDAASAYARIRADCERSGKPVGPNDLFIAAIVIASNGILVTRNTEGLSVIRDLRLEDWTEAAGQGEIKT